MGDEEEIVEDRFEIDEDSLEELADEKGGFWLSSHEFYQSVKLLSMERMSEKQQDWLEKIEVALDKERM